MTVVATLPTRTIAANSSFDLGPVNCPAGASQMTVAVQDQGWPHAGGTAMSLQAFLSQDGGTNWTMVAAAAFDDATTPAAGNFAANEHAVIVTLADAAIGQRKLRMTVVTFSKALPTSGSITAV